MWIDIVCIECGEGFVKMVDITDAHPNISEWDKYPMCRECYDKYASQLEKIPMIVISVWLEKLELLAKAICST